MCIYMQIHLYMYIYVYICVYKDRYIYIYIYTSASPPSFSWETMLTTVWLVVVRTAGEPAPAAVARSLSPVSLAAEAVQFGPTFKHAVAPALAMTEPAEEPTLDVALVCPEKLELGGGGGILLDSTKRANRA